MYGTPVLVIGGRPEPLPVTTVSVLVVMARPLASSSRLPNRVITKGLTMLFGFDTVRGTPGATGEYATGQLAD